MSVSSNEEKDLNRKSNQVNQSLNSNKKWVKTRIFANSMDFNDFMEHVGMRLGERPRIIDDIIYHLTGRWLTENGQKIDEKDEFKEKKAIIPKAVDDEELNNMKKSMKKDHLKIFICIKLVTGWEWMCMT